MRYARMLCLLFAPCMIGCAMCASVDDYCYSAYGGAAERYDMTQERVGSAFGFASDEVVTMPSGESMPLMEVMPDEGLDASEDPAGELDGDATPLPPPPAELLMPETNLPTE